MHARSATFDYLRTVLGIRTLLRSEVSGRDVSGREIDGRETNSPEIRPPGPAPEERFSVYGPPSAPFGFVISTPVAFTPQILEEGNWRNHLPVAYAAQLEKMILATGFAPENISLLFLNEQNIHLITPDTLAQILGQTGRWIVMGPSAVSVFWQTRPITTVRGQVFTKGTTYLWATWGIWEMNANPALKREVWADMKRAFQGFMIEAPTGASGGGGTPR